LWRWNRSAGRNGRTPSAKADPEIFQSLGEPKCDKKIACTSMKMNISYEKNTFNKSFDGHGTLRTH
jgi:hypothetical protein